MLNEIYYYNTDNPLPILRSCLLRASTFYSGVSLSTNKDLKAHGPFKLVFRSANWFRGLKQLLYLKPVMKSLGKIDHYVDQTGKAYSLNEFEEIPIKNRHTIHSGKQLRGNPQFANEQEWYSAEDIKFDLKDVAEIVVMQNTSHTKHVVSQLKQEFPQIPVHFAAATNSSTKIRAELFKSITIKDRTGERRELEIYMNPRKYEIREILKYTEYPKGVTPYVDFFIDFRHKVIYIWNGEYATHADVASLIPLDMHHEETVSGIAEILYPEYQLNPLALYQGKRNFKEFEWEWLDKYLRRISVEYEMIAKNRVKAAYSALLTTLRQEDKIQLAEIIARLHAKVYYTHKSGY